MFIFHFSVKKNDQQNPLAGIEKNKDTKKSQKIIIDFRKSSIADFFDIINRQIQISKTRSLGMKSNYLTLAESDIS